MHNTFFKLNIWSQLTIFHFSVDIFEKCLNICPHQCLPNPPNCHSTASSEMILRFNIADADDYYVWNIFVNCLQSFQLPLKWVCGNATGVLAFVGESKIVQLVHPWYCSWIQNTATASKILQILKLTQPKYWKYQNGCVLLNTLHYVAIPFEERFQKFWKVNA